tara:strand:- start:256 stop:1395 length:1140 start_codon:yes stop_codon:yes gene_type:complete
MNKAIIDIYSTDYHNNLYENYAALRTHAPVYFDQRRNTWMLTRYDDVRAALRDTKRFKSTGTSQDFVPQLQALDGIQHTRIRKEVISEFSQQIAMNLSPRVDRVVETLFKTLNPSFTTINILTDVIHQLPRRIVSEFMGFPNHLRQRWYDLGEPMVGLDPNNPQQPSATLFQDMIDVVDEAVAYKRKDAGHDLLSWLVAREKANVFTADDVELVARTLGFAALDTTINLLANGTALLAKFPLQRQHLIDNPALLDNAIEEMLRIESPTQSLPRRLANDVELHGVIMKAGDEVSLLFGAANHDPEKYNQPDDFDIERKNFDHLAFGFGLHKCIGQHIARIEARSYFSALLKYHPNFLVTSHRWMISPWARAHAELLLSHP